VAARQCVWIPNNPYLDRPSTSRPSVPDAGYNTAVHVESSRGARARGGGRPSTAPAPAPSGAGPRPQAVDWKGVMGASVTPALAAAGEISQDARVLKVKEAALQEIVTRQIYQPARLRALFDGLLELGYEGPDHAVRDACSQAVAELRRELSVA